MRDVVILLIGVVAGFVAQALTGWLQDKRTDEREHRKWVRDQRLEAYTDFLSVAHNIILDGKVHDMPNEVNPLFAAFVRVGLVNRSDEAADVFSPLFDALAWLSSPDNYLAEQYKAKAVEASGLYAEAGSYVNKDLRLNEI